MAFRFQFLVHVLNVERECRFVHGLTCTYATDTYIFWMVWCHYGMTSNIEINMFPFCIADKGRN